MAHILYKLGAAALRPRQGASGLLRPLISFEQAMRLREQFHKEEQPWPYEHIVPGTPKLPAGSKAYIRRKAATAEAKQERVKEVQQAMAKMPDLIKQYREMRKMQWEEVEPVDHLTMTRTAIRRKYTKKRLGKGL